MVINMSAQDRTEEILRQMHILLAGSESYDGIGSKIILDKKRMLELFYLPAAGGRKTYSSRDCECLLSMR
jgi:hypothetical protein